MEVVRETCNLHTVSSKVQCTAEPRFLPENIIAGIVKYTRMAKGTDHMITNDQILPKLYEELGWN